jgi:acyl carrier protein
MATTPPTATNPALARFPADVLEAYQRYRTKGDAGAVEAVVVAAVVDYRPSSSRPVSAVTDGTRLIEELEYDSVAVAELVFFLEDLFDVTLSNDDIVGVRTIADLRTCVNCKLAGKARPA